MQNIIKENFVKLGCHGVGEKCKLVVMVVVFSISVNAIHKATLY